MSSRSPYDSPDSQLIERFNDDRVGKLDQRQLRTAAWLCVLFIMVEIGMLVMQFGSDTAAAQPGMLFASTLYTILVLHVLNVFRNWLNVRFDFRRANGAIGALMVVNVALLLLELLWPQRAWEENNIAFVLATLAASGVIQINFGYRILQLDTAYPYLRTMGLTAVVSGICLVSIILLLLAIVFGIASEILMARVLFEAADEVRRYHRARAVTEQAIEAAKEEPGKDADASSSEEDSG